MGARLENDPTNPNAVMPGAFAYNPAIDRRRGDYEYRVVVRGQGNGSDFETVVVVHARSRLSGEEVLRRAFRSFQRNENFYHSRDTSRDYRRRIGQLGQNPTMDGWILSAARNPGAAFTGS